MEIKSNRKDLKNKEVVCGGRIIISSRGKVECRSYQSSKELRLFWDRVLLPLAIEGDRDGLELLEYSKKQDIKYCTDPTEKRRLNTYLRAIFDAIQYLEFLEDEMRYCDDEEFYIREEQDSTNGIYTCVDAFGKTTKTWFYYNEDEDRIVYMTE